MGQSDPYTEDSGPCPLQNRGKGIRTQFRHLCTDLFLRWIEVSWRRSLRIWASSQRTWALHLWTLRLSQMRAIWSLCLPTWPLVVWRSLSCCTRQWTVCEGHPYFGFWSSRKRCWKWVDKRRSKARCFEFPPRKNSSPCLGISGWSLSCIPWWKRRSRLLSEAHWDLEDQAHA
mgnify:CR=1 FL=1